MLVAGLGLQRGHGRGASPSKPRIRVRSSHSPHQGGRAGRHRVGGGSSAGESRAASTAYGLRAPVLFAPVKAASACGIQPALQRGPHGRGEPGPLGRGQPPVFPEHGEEHADGPAAACCAGRGRDLARGRGGGGRFDGWFFGRFGCNPCTP